LVYALKDVPKTVVIGAKGFVGKHFYDFYRTHHPETLKTHHSPIDEYELLNLGDFSLDFLSGKKYAYGVIAAGITNPRECEKNPLRTHFINVEQTLALSKALLKQDIIPILFSSDYVFDGKKPIYREDSLKCPLNQYGREKAELEDRAQKELSHYCMIRMSKLYGTTKGDKTIFDQMAHLISQNQIVKAATDQILCPLHIRDAVRHVVKIQQEKRFGVIHVSASEKASRYQYAKFIGEALGKPELVSPMLLGEMQDGVKRPLQVLLESDISFTCAFDNILQLVEEYKPSFMARRAYAI